MVQQRYRNGEYEKRIGIAKSRGVLDVNHADALVAHEDRCGIWGTPRYAIYRSTGGFERSQFRPCNCNPTIDLIFKDGRKGRILAGGTVEMQSEIGA